MSDGPAGDVRKATPDAKLAWHTQNALHQDRLLWSRTQTLMVLQAGVLAGSYKLAVAEHGLFAILLASLGAVLTLLLCLWAIMDREDRDKAIDEAEALLGETTIFSKQPRCAWRAWATTHITFPFIMILFIAMDVAMAILYGVAPHLFEGT